MTQYFEFSVAAKRRVWTSGFVSFLKGLVTRLGGDARIPELHADEWSPYMLRDIGLSDRGAETDPRSVPAGWPLR